MSSDSGGSAGAEISSSADLVRWFHEGLLERAGAEPRIGVEWELLPIDPASGEARAYSGPAGVEAALERIASAGHGFQEDRTRRGGRLIQLQRGALSINLEPGAQAEISGSPLATLGDIERELREAAGLLGGAARGLGFRFVSHGVQPVSSAEEIEVVPKRRYDVMTRFLAERGGPRFRDMMRRTASVQASFDFTSEEDAGRKLRAALLGAPVAAALFANAPLTGGRPSGLHSERALVWTETDPARQGMIPELLDGAWSFERYVAYALDVPAILVRAEDGGVETAGGRTFRDLLAGGAPSGRRVTRADWELHLTTIFTDARLKRVVECRSCDAPPPRDALAVPAFWTGLLYHPPSLAGALELVAPHGPALVEARGRVAREGLLLRLDPGPVRLLDLARGLVSLAGAGLDARGRGERRLLAPAEEAAETGRPPGARALTLFERGGISALIEDAAV